MNILVIGDPHLKSSSQQACVKFLLWLQEIIIQVKPDYVVILGDTFHTHNIIRSEVMALIDAHLRWIQANYHGIYYILVGNHDMAHHKTPEIHAWLPYKNVHSKVVIVDSPLHLVNNISYLPYIDSHEEFNNQLDLAMMQSDLIFCHQTFRGANFGFITTKEGAQIPTNYAGQIISGHIHKGQDLGCVWYPGTPFAQEASDHNEIKGIYLYDHSTKKRTFFKSPLPQWVTCKATAATFEAVIASMDKSNKNHLVIEGPGLEVNAVVDSKRFKELKKEFNFTVKKQSTSSIKSSKILKKVNTVEDAVVEYIDRIYSGTVDKSQLKSKCLASLQ
jgi:DNA repair exonuclease SbcCD nuclease subunit